MKMQKLSVCLAAVIALVGLTASVCSAQPPGGFDGGPGRMMRMLPLMTAIDADANGEISADEIKNAAAALTKLDKNSDGKLTADELPRLPFPGPPGFGPPGGPGGPGQMLERLRNLDSNQDGKISREEAPERMREMFDRIDANGDDSLDPEELKRMAERWGGQAPPGEPGNRPGLGGPPGGNFVQRLLDLDTNEDGKLGKEELPERMQESFSRFDSNGDGFLDKDEVKAMAERMTPPGGIPGPGGLVDRFPSLDQNGDGKLTKDECPEWMQRMFERIDANGDGAVDKEELKAAGDRMREREGRGPGKQP
jgi:collagen type III alpha